MVFFLARDLFDRVAAFTGRFVGFDSSTVWRLIDDIHWASATGLYAGHMLMLKGLNESSMTLSFLRYSHARLLSLDSPTSTNLNVRPIDVPGFFTEQITNSRDGIVDRSDIAGRDSFGHGGQFLGGGTSRIDEAG